VIARKAPATPAQPAFAWSIRSAVPVVVKFGEPKIDLVWMVDIVGETSFHPPLVSLNDAFSGWLAYGACVDKRHQIRSR
jgi:hypothetical protein